jgi:hypothetical protein
LAQYGTPYPLGSIEAVSEVGFSPGCFSCYDRVDRRRTGSSD